MQIKNKAYRFIILVAALVLSAVPTAKAQVQISGDFMTRNYWERFTDDLDGRENLEYMRYLGRLTMKSPVGKNAKFHTDFVTISENPVYPSRSLAGTGGVHYGISQIYGEFMSPNFPGCDLARLRFGRQHYKLGNGLTMGDSYYQLEDYDGLRADFSLRNWTFGLFGAITEQKLTPGGFYPEPESDQLYVSQLQYEFQQHTLLGYSVYEKKIGSFNDNVTFGAGSSGSIVLPKLEYFAEVAHQSYNTLSGLPEMGGSGYMASLSYRWSMAHFRSVKVEVRTAGYQGDDAATDKVEIFSPIYPSWWWGDRTGFANGSIGGDYPNRNKQVEGSRVWYGRVYFSPNILPKSRIQFQYTSVGDWVNNDDFTEPDDEFGVKIFYQISDNVRVQGRYFKRMPNGEDFDLNGSGSISRIEDKVTAERLMFEFRLQF